jgi:biopolymer transport protein ExbD
MKQSRRAERMQRRHDRKGMTPGFNLVSLMDIFTILVFFLLVNSSDGEVLPSTRNVQLPESISEQKFHRTVVVTVTDKDILVQGAPVAALADVSADQNIAALKTALAAELTRLNAASPDAGLMPVLQPEITILGTKQTPYQVLKKVMTSCTEAGYAKISLAVLQKASQEI